MRASARELLAPFLMPLVWRNQANPRPTVNDSFAKKDGGAPTTITENFYVVGKENNKAELPNVIPSALVHVINTLESDCTYRF